MYFRLQRICRATIQLCWYYNQREVRVNNSEALQWYFTVAGYVPTDALCLIRCDLGLHLRAVALTSRWGWQGAFPANQV